MPERTQAPSGGARESESDPPVVSEVGVEVSLDVTQHPAWPTNPQQLFGAITDGIVVVDGACSVQYSNAAAECLFGRTKEQLRGMCCHDDAWSICAPDGELPDNEQLACSRSLKSGECVESVEQTIRRPDGTQIDVLVSSSPILDADGAPIGVVNSYASIAEVNTARLVVEETEKHTRSVIRLCEMLGGATTYADILQAAEDEISAITGYLNVWLFLLPSDSAIAYMLDFHGPFVEKVKQLMQLDSRFLAEVAGEQFLVLPMAGDPMLQEIIEANHIVVVEDARTDPRTDKGIVSVIENRTIINVPLSLTERPLGILGLGTFGDEGVLAPTPRQVDYLCECAIHIAVAMDRVSFVAEIREARDALSSMVEHLKKLTEGIVETLSNTTSQCDPYTALHQERVARLACEIAAELEMDPDDVDGLRTAALLHDIGKITVPTEILSKPGTLSEMEMGIIRSHATIGYQLLEHVEFQHPVAETVLQHHERLDGSGYPQGLHGDEISQPARVLAVADVVEAMASYRPYRPALGVEAAMAEILEHADTKYDPDVVKACVCVMQDRTELP